MNATPGPAVVAATDLHQLLPNGMLKDMLVAADLLSNRWKAQNHEVGRRLAGYVAEIDARHAAAELAAAIPAVPQGWKLVPVEPTPEMMYHGGEATSGLVDWGEGDHPDDAPDNLAEAVYRSMIAAAPPAVPLQGQAQAAPAADRTDAEQAAWLADKIVALGDYAKEAAAMLRRWPAARAANPPASELSDDILDALEKAHHALMTGLAISPAINALNKAIPLARSMEKEQGEVGVITSMVQGGVTWQTWPDQLPDGTRLYALPPTTKAA